MALRCSSPHPAALPVGIFDSGVGGLHVLAAIRRRLPGRALIYLGDTARLPYGNKSQAVVRAYARRCADFLVRRGVGAVVVACNTASAQAAAGLAASLPVPVFGVVEAGARAVARAGGRGAIGVLATYGTLASGSYQRALTRLLPGREVIEVPCPLWVALAEEDMGEHLATRLVVARDLERPARRGCDTLVLGCTHYPLLAPLVAEVARELWAAAGHPPPQLVEGADTVAEEVAERLACPPEKAPQDAAPAPCTLLATDDSPRLWSLGARLLGAPLPAPERVDI